MTMVRFLFLGLLAAITVACNTAPEYSVPKTQSPALWMVEDEHGNRGYIIGSVHMLPDGLNWVTPKMEGVLRQCQSFVTEIGGTGNRAMSSNAWLEKAQDEAVPPLAERLGTHPEAIDLVPKRGKLRVFYNKSESWAIALTLASSLSEQLDIEAENGVEAVLAQRFKKRGITVHGLETAQDQFDRFDALPPAAQDRLLLSSLLASSDARAQYQSLLTAWLTGDLDALAAVSDADIRKDPDLYKALIVTPNQTWSLKILAQIRERETPCIAIGSAHLLGEDSVLARLKESGMMVTRIQ